jgi:hypothetical protein
MSDPFPCQHGLFAPPDTSDPRLKRTEIAQRDTSCEVFVVVDCAESMRFSEGRVRVVLYQRAKFVSLTQSRLFQRTAKTAVRRPV